MRGIFMGLAILGGLCQTCTSHDTRFYDTRFINPTDQVITVVVGTIRRTIGGDMVQYTIKINPKSSEMVPLRHPTLSRIEATMQSPRANLTKTLPKGNYVRSFAVTYGEGPTAKTVVAGQEELKALNQCVNLLEKKGRKSKESGLQFLRRNPNMLQIPFACAINGKPLLEFGINNVAQEAQNVLSYSAENPDPFEDYIKTAGGDPGIPTKPARAAATRHLYQEDSQYNYPEGWDYYPEYDPEVHPDAPGRLQQHQDELPGGHTITKIKPLVDPRELHTTAY